MSRPWRPPARPALATGDARPTTGPYWVSPPRHPHPHLGWGAFLVHMASFCPLATNGSVLDFDFTLVFNKNPLVCYEPDARRFTPCDWGLLRPYAVVLAAILNNGTDWVQRAEARRRACSDLAPQFWSSTVLRRTPPRARIISSKTRNTRASVLLTCHVWGFYPAEVTVSWLHNGNIVGPGDPPPTSAIPNGDWTYQTQVTLMVAPTAGDTFACLVQHVSLDEPLLEEWSPGLSPGLTVKVAVATVLMVLGLSFFIVGVYCYRGKPPAPGYTPLPGDTYPAGSI
ncbi:HLA class II histocompatibility antigen, DM beta chain-like isoform X1 [Harpia harpyja]|uniref:HLA class II histocompatibility antigen, DM beta chain-like isoform X1 n=1 Tax=Harpia harpyja TaxID=202280 RepID=UPI0022B179E6|nr:HLA class II histocompatibility antigen, DM beta chain-like isoform X1 [Harpia harpyja]